MLEIYLIRHGRTLFNQKDLVQGACDSELTQEGVMQAKAVGENMKDIGISVLFNRRFACVFSVNKIIKLSYINMMRFNMENRLF